MERFRRESRSTEELLEELTSWHISLIIHESCHHLILSLGHWKWQSGCHNRAIVKWWSWISTVFLNKLFPNIAECVTLSLQSSWSPVLAHYLGSQWHCFRDNNLIIGVY
jgi:hypothetical protein